MEVKIGNKYYIESLSTKAIIPATVIDIFEDDLGKWVVVLEENVSKKVSYLYEHFKSLIVN
jgi:hypothetical protein